MLIALFAGCRTRAPEPPENSEEVSESVSESSAASIPASQQGAVDKNADIDPSDVHIIQFNNPKAGDQIAVITTSEGVIRIRLFPEQAPKTVEAFTNLVKDGYYNGQKVSTIINGFKIQAGDPSAASAKSLPADGEFSFDLWNFRGAVTATGKGSEFLIVQAKSPINSVDEMKQAKFPEKVIKKYEETGGAPHLDWNNTVFGQVINGMDIVDKIAALDSDDDGKPSDEIIITTVTIETH